MAKHKKNKIDDSVVVVEETNDVIAESEPETIDEIVVPVQVIGVVTDCSRLNVRRYPTANAEIVSELIAGSEVMIEDDESTDEFYKICTASGIEGFCMKKFITVR